MRQLNSNDGVLDEVTASPEAGGSGVERGKIKELAALIEERIEPCMQLLGMTWDDVLPANMTVGDLRMQITQALGPLLLDEQDNLATYLVQVFRRLRAEKLEAMKAQSSISESIASMTASFAAYLRSVVMPARAA